MVNNFEKSKWYEVVKWDNEREWNLRGYKFQSLDDGNYTYISDICIFACDCDEIEDPFSTNCKLNQDNVILKTVIKDEIHDNVNSPNHYKLDGLDIESKDVIRALLGNEMYLGWLWGNMLKYSFRWNKKNGIEDLRKARKFNEWIEELESEGK
ncbi:DUF3310 domain-containing protein [Peptostreptococcus equinus]|uniref:DUF3310 domain-containing protein n=1 Tax=Peptostreptococcus equinus TaxID=3003601 RepID=A0ABY7JQ49_9FIRM|nr:DUF3310 domain-containing protein [Peptostreptococcus sp. CBA3647]WAW14626.1 DUF3310 domain-containing protein [Peptostreptococcus sp. CBA3647]